MDKYPFIVYLPVMAGITYLVRMLPLVLIKRQITNRYLLSFLQYIPYAVLSAMTVPACFYSTGTLIPAVIGFAVAFLFAWHRKSLPIVAVAACASAFLTDVVIRFVL